MSRVVLAMSGGIDSSASAWLLKEQGHEVIGLFMRSGAAETESCATAPNLLPIVNPKSHKQGCCSASDAADARRVADALDISFHALNFSDAFEQIKDYFADEYLAGRTPNPCVMCNVWLKFGKLWDFAEQVGAEYIATGHYAQLTAVPGESTPGLFRGLDAGKDQSYVLFGIRRELLSKILFPVGGYQKEALRDLARHAGIRTADKPDSQEICFIPDNDYGRFLRDYRGEQETDGELVDTAGNVLGRHAGYQHFTIGQRRGLGVTFGEPRFVVRIEPETHRVVLGNREELGRRTLSANRLNWLAESLSFPLRATAQIRYQHKPAWCVVEKTGDDRIEVTFDDPQYGVAPGQAVAIYNENRILGGGWIL
ncbi:tRNA 2-thiouridine(34) synthase MnmA [Planctomicrobium sp. SH661]|uniref:tRNA 2-thiouridine(34) synthase MnmA n=1 Tax=Planctomicrobium sp. SH661 TaxID=3448124 RepID=UPI003F5BF754